MRTDAGQSAFSVLLFQDIAVIPMLALLPLLATVGHAAGDDGHGHAAETWTHGLPGWAQALVVLSAVAAIILGGRFIINPTLRLIARTQLRELFTAMALLFVIGIAILMSRVGLSPALGTFLAGVVLANSEYRHELESDLEPFKGLLLGLFFITVGASINFGLVTAAPVQILGLVAGLAVVKFLILLGLAYFAKMRCDQRFLFAFSLAQGGEFGFVLFSFAKTNGIVPGEVADPLVAVVALSMALAPLLMILNDHIVRRFSGTRELPEREADTMEESNPVIIAGFGRFGHIVGRLLSANGIGATVLDIDSDQVDLLRSLGLKVYYGDASRRELLEAAGAGEARLLVLATEEPEKRLEIVHTVKKHFPGLEIFARAEGRADAYELRDAGVDHIFRETLDSSLELGIAALQHLGVRAHQARRAARIFRAYDENTVREMGAVRHDEKAYRSSARQHINNLEDVLREDVKQSPGGDDRAWDTESLRQGGV